jgi:hypothetical protein
VEQGVGRMVAVWMIMWAWVVLIFASHLWTTLKGTFFQDKLASNDLTEASKKNHTDTMKKHSH